MTLDVNETVRTAIETYGTYLSIEQLGQRWHTAPAAIGQPIRDGPRQESQFARRTVFAPNTSFQPPLLSFLKLALGASKRKMHHDTLLFSAGCLALLPAALGRLGNL